MKRPRTTPVTLLLVLALGASTYAAESAFVYRMAEAPAAATQQPMLTLPESYPVTDQTTSNRDDAQVVERVGVVPYGGGHPDDWLWGLGGSPYRTGPGWMDDWQVGPIWNVSVDGMTLFREDADLAALTAQAQSDGAPGTVDYNEQFDFSGGGRVFATGLLPRDVGYQVQFGYEGVEEWNAAVVFPKVSVAGMTVPPDTVERRSVGYRSSLHSAELNVLPVNHSVWQPYFGFRYVRFGDEISDVTDQSAPPPLLDPDADPVSVDDMSTVFDIKNNLIGFQSGLRYDLWKFSRRFSLQGFLNAGVYLNHIQRTDLMSTTTTTYTADDPLTMDIDETSTTVSSTTSTVSTEPSDVAYLAEASLTGVFRINKSLALRGGYQIVWIEGLRLSDDAYLDTGLDSRSLWFDGWHIGAEYRR